MRTAAVPEIEEGNCGFQKRERRMIRERMSGAGERGRESAKERYYWRDGREEGRIGYTNKGRRKGGRPGDRAGLGKIQAFPSKFEFAWEKKGGGRKGGRAEHRWVWKISGSVARASANAKTERMAGKKKKCDCDWE